MFLYQKINISKPKCVIYGRHIKQNDTKKLWEKKDEHRFIMQMQWKRKQMDIVDI